MMAADTWHPSPQQLRAYGVGRLALSERLAIEAHVADCEECVASLAAAPDDALVGRVKEGLGAGPRSAELTAVVRRSKPLPRPAAPEIPAALADHPRYRILRLIGAGGMGVVWLAEHRLMKRQVALKVLRGGTGATPEAAARFQKEVEACARLSHPNVVAAHDAERAGGLTFLVMEYVEGTDLDALVRQNGPLPTALACECLRQAARGLDHAMRHRIVHRDLKPSNLMLTPHGVVKILDFGLASLLSPDGHLSASGEGLLMGTPDYIAPEQAEGSRTADHRADLYSLGCTFFFLLAGRHPYQEKGPYEKLLAHRFLSPPDPVAFRPDLPGPVREVVRRMLSKDPTDRYQTAAETAKAVEELFRSGIVELEDRSSSRSPSPRAMPPRRGRWRVLAGAGVLFLLVLWATFPPAWTLVPPPPWGDQWMKRHGKLPGWEKDPKRGPDKQRRPGE